jgi:hypothetical protein
MKSLLSKEQESTLAIALKNSEGFAIISNPEKLTGGTDINLNLGRQCSCSVTNSVAQCGCSTPQK